MKKIRNNVFETNSSSTHSICIATDAELIIPQSLHFSFGEFGWECDTLNSVEEKASYLYTGLMANHREEDKDKIIQVLKDKNIDITVEEPIYKTYTYEGSNGESYIDNGGYIDHAYDLNEFLDNICDNEENLLQFLFSPLSFIITGNDNDDESVDINVNYSHIEFYKGN